MAIKVVDFGGLVPKASPRALPNNAAQVASDLQADTHEFRPLATDTTVVASSGVTNPKTIHRLARTAGGAFNTDMTTGWIVKAGEMSFVKAQINDDTTERTHATFDDGSAPPRVYDASDLVTGRQLGVPFPASAPTVAVNVVDQFSTADRAAAIKDAQRFMRDICDVVAVATWRGGFSLTPSTDKPGTSTDGWVDRNGASGTGLTGVSKDDSQVLRVFRLTSTGGADNGAIGTTYAADGPDYYQWVTDPTLGGFYATSDSGWPTWASTSKDHWCVPISAYGLTYDLDQAQLKTYLLTMETAGVSPTTALMTSGQADEIVAKVLAYSDQQWAEAQPLLESLKTQTDTMHALLGGGGTQQRIAAITAFYAKTDVAAEITSAIAALAESTWNLAVQAHDAVPYTALSPGG